LIAKIWQRGGILNHGQHRRARKIASIAFRLNARRLVTRAADAELEVVITLRVMRLGDNQVDAA